MLDGRPDRQVRHRAAATGTPDESVAAALQDAARRAARRGGIAAAVTALEHAAALSEDADRRAELRAGGNLTERSKAGDG
ncbi:hypothetical protein ACGF13_18930 [Kitasatospora sp. NPDC048286]|uniref:hypothetical protein n=1 Tax=Kitasatospora sp. NPDC048286 TaxID=3364047 RepID=UPI0037116F2D